MFFSLEISFFTFVYIPATYLNSENDFFFKGKHTVTFNTNSNVINDLWFDCYFEDYTYPPKAYQWWIPDDGRRERKVDPTFDCSKYKACVYLSPNNAKVFKSTASLGSECEFYNT